MTEFERCKKWIEKYLMPVDAGWRMRKFGFQKQPSILRYHIEHTEDFVPSLETVEQAMLACGYVLMPWRDGYFGLGKYNAKFKPGKRFP